MSSFWDTVKLGVPTLGAIGAFAYAKDANRSTVESLVMAGGGWAGGYILFRLLQRASNSMESLPDTVVTPMVNVTEGPPSIDGVLKAVESHTIKDASSTQDEEGVVIDMVKTKETKTKAPSGVAVSGADPYGNSGSQGSF